jgi:hypothetical protein
MSIKVWAPNPEMNEEWLLKMLSTHADAAVQDATEMESS